MNLTFHFQRIETTSGIEHWVKITTAQVNSLVLDWRGLEESDLLYQVAIATGLNIGESAEYLIDLSFEQFCELEMHRLIFRNLLDENWESEQTTIQTMINDCR